MLRATQPWMTLNLSRTIPPIVLSSDDDSDLGRPAATKATKATAMMLHSIKFILTKSCTFDEHQKNDRDLMLIKRKQISFERCNVVQPHPNFKDKL